MWRLILNMMSRSKAYFLWRYIPSLENLLKNTIPNLGGVFISTRQIFEDLKGDLRQIYLHYKHFAFQRSVPSALQDLRLVSLANWVYTFVWSYIHTYIYVCVCTYTHNSPTRISMLNSICILSSFVRHQLCECFLHCFQLTKYI